MFSHIMVGTNDFDRAKAFYDAVLATLGAGPGNINEAGTGHKRAFWFHNGGIFAISQPINNEPAACANGATIGFAARVVFAAIEYAGELVGLQMGLNFAMFFDPVAGGQVTSVSRFYGTTASWLFVVMNGHLLLTGAVLHSFKVFPIAPEPLAFLSAIQPQVWGTELFKLGVWVSLPVVAMLLLVNMVMGLISRVSPQMNVFSVGFPLTLAAGLTGLWLTLPLMQAPLTMAIERMLAQFQ